MTSIRVVSLMPSLISAALGVVTAMLCTSGKPVKVFGLTAGGDPKHPLMLPYDTPLVDWAA
ncbi:hypothetical protein BCO71033_02740 [Burkholderia contaminans]|uniref:Uncharacterized protein n=1 Tax=Burkholderia contaminans TaxID=488447 RepID=A0A6P2Y0I7_9BURK|nr:hypothetical protein BCO71033_02740 [Burkholderia contaminans]